MFGFLGFLLILFLLILLIGFSILGSILRLFFRLGRRGKDGERTCANPDTPRSSSPDSRKQKIFDKDEGEYVDYEEMK